MDVNRCVFFGYQYLFDSNTFLRLNCLLLSIFVLKSCIIISNSSKSKEISSENASYFRNSQNLFNKLQNTEYLKSVLDSLQNSSYPFDLPGADKQFLEQIYGKIEMEYNLTVSAEIAAPIPYNLITRNPDLKGKYHGFRYLKLMQISSWLSGEDKSRNFNQTYYLKDKSEKYVKEDQNSGDLATAEALRSERVKSQHSLHSPLNSANSKPNDSQTTHILKNDEEEKDDSANHNYEKDNEEDNGPAGASKSPPCAHYGRYYCSYKEDYPIKVVIEVTKYYKWPLEKLFRDLRHQVMPTLANDNSGGLVCDSITRIVRPGWSKNTNGRWLVVINTDHYQQYVTEVICRHGTGSYCNFIPPCYHSSCRQRYNTQKLLVIDPWNPYKGPFLSEFLFPSCCVCYIPGENVDNSHSSTPGKLTGAQANSYSSPSGTISSIDKSPEKVS